MAIPEDEQASTAVTPNFDVPEFDGSTKFVVKVTSEYYDSEFELLQNGDKPTISVESEDLPAEFEGVLTINQLAGNEFNSEIFGYANSQYTIKVLSIDHNGRQIYP